MSDDDFEMKNLREEIVSMKKKAEEDEKDEFFEYNDDPAFDDLEMKNWREEMKALEQTRFMSDYNNKQFKGLREGIRDYGRKIMSEASGKMTDILETGKSGIITHEKFGGITVDAGEARSRSFGLKHIIKQRYDEGKSTKEMTALLVLLDTTLKNGEKTRDITFKRQPEHRGRMELEAGGIVAIVNKQRKQGDNEHWVLTGFEDKKNKEAADAIQKVISRYGYTPEFLGLEKQVGAVVSSLQVSPQSNNKSSEIETARKAGYVQGVCECVAAIGEDHALGKKLLAEMNVNKDMAKKYANPETYKTLEQGIFAPKPEQQIEQKHSRNH